MDAWSVSAARPDVALRRPLAEIVDAALKAPGRSEHTRRSYYSAILLFLQVIDRERGGRIPAKFAGDWRPGCGWWMPAWWTLAGARG